MGQRHGQLVLRWTHLINSFATSAYRVMTGVKRLDKVHNTMVLRSVFRNDLIHTVHDRQLRFLGHMFRNTHSPYALYKPTYGKTRRGCPQLNYVDYIEKVTGTKVNELLEVSQDCDAWHDLVVACVDLWSTSARLERESFLLSESWHEVISLLVHCSLCAGVRSYGVWIKNVSTLQMCSNA